MSYYFMKARDEIAEVLKDENFHLIMTDAPTGFRNLIDSLLDMYDDWESQKVGKLE